MIPKECKRLAEVDFPIAVVSKHSAREKSIRHGHPSTLHLWWARRPLGACRAMLLALLLPDPCDPHCPAGFKKKARALLTKTPGQVDADDMGLRKGLLRFIGDFADWDNSSQPTYLEVGRGLVSRAKAKCLNCGTVMHPDRTRAQIAAQHGGADALFDDKGNRVGDARMMAVVALRPGEAGRHYRIPTERDYHAVFEAQQRLEEVNSTPLPNGLSPVPDEPLPPIGTLGFRVQRYGMLHWGDLFTARQKLSLLALCGALLSRWATKEDGQRMLAETLSCVLGKRADYASSGTKWHLTFEKTTCTFGRQAIPITWDFVEPVPHGDTSGSFGAGLDAVCSAAATVAKAMGPPGQVAVADATSSPLPDASCDVWFTDPPCYDAIPYSDLSDFFLVWLKRGLAGSSALLDPYDPSNLLSQKDREIVQDETKSFEERPKNRAFFEDMMGRAFAEGGRVLRADGIASIVFAHKTTEGWEALLTGLIRGQWTITSSWPIATERAGRLRSLESAALATSVHLVCRPRPEGAPTGDWGDVLRELPRRVGDWVERLQGEGIRGADLVFACIGPALEIYSRYSKVEDAEGSPIPTTSGL